jgi:hypothetical protein
MMAMRSHRMSASSMKWVVSTMLRPAFWERMKSQALRRLNGSMPVVGSSRRTTAGPPMKAMAKLSFRFWPPDSVPAAAVAMSRMPTATSISSAMAGALALATPRNWANSCRCSTHVSVGHSTSC